MRLFIACLIIAGLHMNPWLYVAAFAIAAWQWLRPKLKQMFADMRAIRKRAIDEERDRQREFADVIHG